MVSAPMDALMKTPRAASLALALSFGLLAACKRGDGASKPGAGGSAAAPTSLAAAVPSAAAAAPPVAPRPALDPRWPRWLPPVSAVTVRMTSRDSLEGYADRPAMLVLVESRRACEVAGYTVSQTDLRRTRWENRFIFTATRGEELVRIELMGQPSRPNFSTFTATTGDFARTLMRRRAR